MQGKVTVPRTSLAAAPGAGSPSNPSDAAGSTVGPIHATDIGSVKVVDIFTLSIVAAALYKTTYGELFAVEATILAFEKAWKSVLLIGVGGVDVPKFAFTPVKRSLR